MNSLLYQMSYDTDTTSPAGSDAVAVHATPMRERRLARRAAPAGKLFVDVEVLCYVTIPIPCPFV